MAWVGENRLGESTACDLLHLLYHLARDVVFESVAVGYLEGEREDWEVNPVVVALLRQPRFRIRAHKLRFTHGNDNLSFNTMKAVGELTACRSICYNLERDISTLLRMVAEGRGLFKAFLFIAHFGYVDEVIEVSVFLRFL